jgi:cobyrinic acid a,c-diamide synthase
MTGLLSHTTSFQKRKLHLGYREARLLVDSVIGSTGMIVRGHEFHYASLTDIGHDEPLVELTNADGHSLPERGGRRGHVTGTFFHAIAAA